MKVIEVTTLIVLPVFVYFEFIGPFEFFSPKRGLPLTSTRYADTVQHFHEDIHTVRTSRLGRGERQAGGCILRGHAV